MAETEQAQDKGIPDTAALAHSNFRAGRDHSSDWRATSETWYDMVAGQQWDQTDLMALEDQQRPAVVFNRILRTINAITGTQVANRQETRYIPREQGDVQINEILTAGADWARDNCDAEDEESDAFRDMLVTGMGWTETRMDYERDSEGQICIERIDPLEMYWDPGARKRNLGDAQWVMHVKLMTMDDFIARWPDADVEMVTSPWDGAEDDVSKRTHVYPQDAYKINQSNRKGGKGTPKVRVAHMQWAVREDAYRVGKRAERVSAKAFKRVQDKLDEAGTKYIRQQRIKWKRAFVAGGSVLEEGDCPFPEGATFRCITGERDRNEGTWFGMVKAMVDPQRFGNKFFSQILDIMNKGSKGGVMIEADATDDMREIESKWARPDAVLKFRSGALSQGKVQEKPLAKLPPGMDRMMQFSMEGIEEVTGASLEFLGMANRQQAGVLEQQRKQAGLTILAPLFDAMRRYRKEQGRVLLYFLQRYISDGRLIRIMGQNGQEQYIPLAKQREAATYDIIVDEAPTSPNMKERVYSALVQILPSLRDQGVPLPPELLDYAPIPSQLAQKWKQQIEQGQQLPPEVQKQMQQLSEENAKLKEKREETMRQLQLKEEESQGQLDLKAAETEADTAIERQKFELEQEKVQAAIDLERWKTEQLIAIKRREAHAELAIKLATATGSGEDAENGATEISLEDIRRIFRDDEPRRRRITMHRDADGVIESADVDDVLSDLTPQGTA